MARVSMMLGGWSVYLGPLLALLIAGGGGVLLRRRMAWVPVACGLAAAVGWLVLAGGGLRAVAWPRGVLEHLVLPAGLVAGAVGLAVLIGGRGRRWLMVGAAVFAGCWLAGSGVGRPEFWRVVFAVVAGAWLLHLVGAGQPRRALVTGLTVWGGVLVAGGAAVWIAAAGVLGGVAAGVLWVGGAVVPVTVLAIGVVGVELGAGRVFRGGFGLVDVACGLAMVAPGLTGWVDRRLGRRLGRGSVVLVPAGIAAVAVAAAWGIGRVSLR